MSQFKTSILMPVYNGAAYLQTALDSVAAQTFRDFELIVCDDGSSDNSAEILARFTGAPTRVVSDNRRRGLFSNLNFLLRQCTTPLARVLCQDDVMRPTCLEAEVEFFKRHPAIAMSFCKSDAIDANGKIIISSALGDLPDELPPILSLQHFFYHGCIPGNLSTVCFRKEDVMRRGGFDETLKVSADYEMWVRLIEQKPMGVIHKRLVGIRSHAKQLSAAASSQPGFLLENREVRDYLIPKLEPEIRPRARAFERRRHDVLDFHAIVRFVLSGRWATAGRMALDFGLSRLGTAAWFWLATGNNRFWRPEVQWVIPADLELKEAQS